MQRAIYLQIYNSVHKFQTQIACQKGLDIQGRPRSDCFFRSSLIRVFPVCYSCKCFVNSSVDNQYIFENKREKCNFRKFTVNEGSDQIFYAISTKHSGTYSNEPVHEISNNVLCVTSKASDQPAHTRSLIRAFASRLRIL